MLAFTASHREGTETGTSKSDWRTRRACIASSEPHLNARDWETLNHKGTKAPSVIEVLGAFVPWWFNFHNLRQSDLAVPVSVSSVQCSKSQHYQDIDEARPPARLSVVPELELHPEIPFAQQFNRFLEIILRR